jgi:hypothetical protein
MNGPGMGFRRAEWGWGEINRTLPRSRTRNRDRGRGRLNYQRVARPPRLRSHFLDTRTGEGADGASVDPLEPSWRCQRPLPGGRSDIGNFSGSEEKA